jgi:hypothetical protein
LIAALKYDQFAAISSAAREEPSLRKRHAQIGPNRAQLLALNGSYSATERWTVQSNSIAELAGRNPFFNTLIGVIEHR